MRIAQVAPLFESVPPRLYGGTERVVSYLTEELVRQGHDVTLFASGDSQTGARLVPVCPEALRLANCADPLALHLVQLERVFERADDFDVIHFHCGYLHLPYCRRHPCPGVTTLHGRLDLPELVPLYREYPRHPHVSISDAQRRPLPWLCWAGTVYHGLPPDLHTFRKGEGGYLAFLGRVSPEKGLDRAVRIACEVGIPLKIAAKVDQADRRYYEDHIKPLLHQCRSMVEFIGEVGGAAKDEFLGNARALLFPINWPEPFGLVMIEAMACGTPVIAWRNGSVPEVMSDGETGFVVDSLGAAVEAVKRVGELDRRRCREVFEERFTADRMARDYLAVYRRVLEEWQGDGRSRAKRPRPWLAPEPPPLIRSGGPAPRVPAAGPMLQPPLG